MGRTEIWKDIPGYEGIYQVSTIGRVRSLDRMITRRDEVRQFKKGVVLSQCLNASGYYNVNLHKNGMGRSCLVNRLVAMTFIENTEGYDTVNHKNEVKTDNRVENLEWMKHKDNCNYGTRNIRHSIHMRGKYMGSEHSHPQKVVCITTNEHFSCIREAAEKYKMKSQSGISACCRGMKKTAGQLPDGTRLKWKYDNT